MSWVRTHRIILNETSDYSFVRCARARMPINTFFSKEKRARERNSSPGHQRRGPGIRGPAVDSAREGLPCSDQLAGRRLWEGTICKFALLRGKLFDRKSTRLNSSHRCISYAVFCL